MVNPSSIFNGMYSVCIFRNDIYSIFYKIYPNMVREGRLLYQMFRAYFLVTGFLRLQKIFMYVMRLLLRVYRTIIVSFNSSFSPISFLCSLSDFGNTSKAGFIFSNNSTDFTVVKFFTVFVIKQRALRILLRHNLFPWSVLRLFFKRYTKVLRSCIRTDPWIFVFDFVLIWACLNGLKLQFSCHDLI